MLTAIRNENLNGCKEMYKKLYLLAKHQPGFIGMESVAGDFEITISYCKDLESIANWKSHPAHIEAQIKISKVERECERGTSILS